MSRAALVWFREDLRLADNPALHGAVQTGLPVVPIFVLDETSGGPRARGAAARWWLHGSLEALTSGLKKLGGALHLFRGDAGMLVPAIAQAFNAEAAFWNDRYDAAGQSQDAAIAQALTASGCRVTTSNGKLLADPQALKSKAGTPFRVFSPFRRALIARGEPERPLPAPTRIKFAAPGTKAPKPLALTALGLLPTKPDWAGGLRETWTPGEPAAGKRLASFLSGDAVDYAADRDKPGRDGSSRLSPHLASGELSSRQVWHAAHGACVEGRVPQATLDKFLAELAWRDFSYHLLAHHPDLATTNFNPRFDRFPWPPIREDWLHAWQRGHTGYPIVDAGMRQLWLTGWMHNRVRLVTASFLVKHLLIDWRQGEDWFWDTLCDADPANNATSWQWVAGSGPDAAPYFRVFNPVLQGEKFDAAGEYVRRYVPELKELPARFVHKPWEAPAAVLAKAGVKLGTDYPRPIVEHTKARARALAALAVMRN